MGRVAAVPSGCAPLTSRDEGVDRGEAVGIVVAIGYAHFVNRVGHHAGSEAPDRRSGLRPDVQGDVAVQPRHRKTDSVACDRGLIAAFPPPFQLVDFIARRFLSVRCDRAVVEVKGYVAKRRVAGDGGIGCFPPHLVVPVITTAALYVIAVDVAGHRHRTGLLAARRRLRRHGLECYFFGACHNGILQLCDGSHSTTFAVA